jgi:regulator of sigma E protease
MDLLTTAISMAQNALSIIIALFGIGFLIGFHEFGHFLFCKLFDIKTPTFSIGFGPILYQRRVWDTDFTLSAIPLGGFVEIAGAAEVGQGEQKDAHSTDKDSFATKPYYQKFLVMTGGILCNLLFAYFAFILLSLIGIPKTPLMPTQTKTVIQMVEPNGAAEAAGLQKGDKINQINDNIVSDNIHLLVETIQPLAQKEVKINYERNGKAQELILTVGHRKGSEGIGSIGVAFEMEEMPPLSFFNAVKQGITLTNDWIVRTFTGIIGMFRKADVKNVGGPVVIISMLTKGATTSFSIFLILLAIISINLAVLNLIPLPILDGGQLLFYTIEAIIGRPLNPKVKEYIHITSWLLIMGLVLYLSVFDIARLAHPYVESVKQFLGFGR